MKQSVYKTFFLVFLLVLLQNLMLKAGDIVIAVQPQAVNLCQGSSAKLMVDAFSQTKQNLYYQWLKDGIKINGETTAVLNINNAAHDVSGVYSCRLTNADSSDKISSRSAAVYVLSPTTITEEPQDVISYQTKNSEPINLIFRAHVNGMPVEDALSRGEFVKIQWFEIVKGNVISLHDDSIFSGTKSNNLSIQIAKLPDTCYFYSTIDGLCGSDTTHIVQVVHVFTDVVWSQPNEGIIDCDGTIDSLEIKISGANQLTTQFHWYKNGLPLAGKANISGLNSGKLIFNPLEVEDAGSYRLETNINEINSRFISKTYIVKVRTKPTKPYVDLRVYRKYINSISDTTRPDSLYLLVYMRKEDYPYKVDIYSSVKGKIETQTMIDNRHTYNSGYATFFLCNVDSDNFKCRFDSTTSYWGVISNECSTTYTDSVNLKNTERVGMHWVIAGYPVMSVNRLTICEGQPIYLGYPEGSYFYMTPDSDNVWSTSDRRKMHYQWYREDGTKLKEGDNIVGAQQTQLLLDPAKLENSGRYYLVGTFDGSDSTHISEMWDLNVIESVKADQPRDTVLNEGDSCSLFTVNLDENPISPGDTTSKISVFFRPNEYVTFNKILETQAKGRYDYIKKVTKSVKGIYYLKIENDCGDYISDIFNIGVIPKNESGNTGSSGNHDSTNTYAYFSNDGTGNIKISAHPIPASNEEIIRIQSRNILNPNYEVSIFNSFGEKITNAQITFSNVSQNDGEIHWNCADLAAGVYFISITINGETKSMPVVVSK